MVRPFQQRFCPEWGCKTVSLAGITGGGGWFSFCAGPEPQLILGPSFHATAFVAFSYSCGLGGMKRQLQDWRGAVATGPMSRVHSTNGSGVKMVQWCSSLAHSG